MVAYSKPQQRKGEGDRLAGESERDKIKLIDLRFERGQASHAFVLLVRVYILGFFLSVSRRFRLLM